MKSRKEKKRKDCSEQPRSDFREMVKIENQRQPKCVTGENDGIPQDVFRNGTREGILEQNVKDPRNPEIAKISRTIISRRNSKPMRYLRDNRFERECYSRPIP
jgi:hypothetical protein